MRLSALAMIAVMVTSCATLSQPRQPSAADIERTKGDVISYVTHTNTNRSMLVRQKIGDLVVSAHVEHTFYESKFFAFFRSDPCHIVLVTTGTDSMNYSEEYFTACQMERNIIVVEGRHGAEVQEKIRLGKIPRAFKYTVR